MSKEKKKPMRVPDRIVLDSWKIMKIGIIIYIAIILIPPILKLVGVAKISWFIALLPLIIPVGLFIISLIIGMLIGIPEIIKNRRDKK